MWAKIKLGMLENVKAEEGQSLVEFALAGLMLMTITFGMMETGRLVYTASVVQAAAQEGARAAIVDEDVINGDVDTADATALVGIVTPAIESKLAALDPDQMTVDRAALESVTMAASPAAITRNTVTVDITYNYQFMIPFIGQLVSEDDSIALRGQANMLVR